jgi:hypothetical protein
MSPVAFASPNRLIPATSRHRGHSDLCALVAEIRTGRHTCSRLRRSSRPASGRHKADDDIDEPLSISMPDGDGDELGPASVPGPRPTAKGVIAVAFTVTTNRYDLLITGSSRISRPARPRLRLSAR